MNSDLMEAVHKIRGVLSYARMAPEQGLQENEKDKSGNKQRALRIIPKLNKISISKYLPCIVGLNLDIGKNIFGARAAMISEILMNIAS